MRTVLLYISIMIVLGRLSPCPARAQSTETNAVQAHLDAAVSLYEQNELDAAIFELDAALRIRKKTPFAHYWKGMIALKAGKLKDAERAFRKAGSMDKRMAEAHNGLGEVYRRRKNRKMDAIESYKEALKRNPQYVEAQYNLAQVYLDISFGDVVPFGFFKSMYAGMGRKALETTLLLDPQHPHANYDLGMIYEFGMNNMEKAITYYANQIAVNPDKPGAVNHLGKSYFKIEKYQDGVKTLNRLIRAQPTIKETAQPALTMLEAMLHLGNSQYDRAQETFESYIQSLPPEEQAAYDDITAVASEDDRKDYERLNAVNQADYRRRFWKQRDSDPTTPANERLIEHYRRVLYARTHFGVGKFPWDRRGEMYLRYGDPDDRQIFVFGIGEKQQTNQGSRRTSSVPTVQSLSNDFRENAQSHAIERMSYAPTGNARVDAIRETNFQLRYQLSVEASTVGLSAYKVESWVYVQMGTELLFVDQLNNGVFDFPLMTESRDVRQIARQGRYHPEKLAREMVKKVPDLYRHDFGGDPLQFYFDVVSFQGEGNHSDVEVAIAVPIYQLGAQSDGKGTETSVEARVSLVNDDWHDAANAHAYFGPYTRPRVPKARDKGVVFTTFQLPVSVLAGDYQIATSVRDAVTRKIGIYRQPVTVASYTSPQLLISDIKLASAVTSTIRKRGPFIRNNLEIVPNPTRIFAGNQSVHIYYELYNLLMNDAEQTSFRTEMTVTAIQQQQGVFGRLLSTFGQLITGPAQNNMLTFTLEDASTTSTTSRYTALDLSESPPGRYTIEVAVTDLLADQTVTRTTEFILTDAIADRDTPVTRWEGGEQETATAMADSIFIDPSPAPDDGTSVLPDTAAFVRGDTGLDTTSTPGKANQSWDQLMGILQSPEYMLASEDSVQQAMQDTSVTAFVSNLEENLNQYTPLGKFSTKDEYEGMVYIPAGMFLMGSDSTGADEGPMQTIHCDAFYIDRNEVTNEDYKRFLDATGHPPPRHWEREEYSPGEARYPVVGVSWYDAQTYARWNGKRLPTEAEWEKAARGDDGRLYPWGDEFIVNWLNVGGDTDGYEQTAPVGSFQEGASPYGALDMAGNAWEWTSDWFQPYKGNTKADPTYGEQYRVIRGGSWINYDGNTRTCNRGKYYPSDTSLLLGFRCGKDAKEDVPHLADRMKGYGYLLIATPGTWADIYIDGEKFGQTPRADPLRLRPGTYTVQLLNPYYQTYERTVEVEADVFKKERAVLVRK